MSRPFSFESLRTNGRVEGHKKVFIFAGESSGDIHGAHLAEALTKTQPDIELIGFGGSAMKNAHIRIIADPTSIAVIGLVEVIRHLPTFRKLFRQAVQTLDEQKPDLVVLIDYPGFNLRFACEVKRRGIRLVYYISPQIWAWGGGRIHQIKKLVDRMLVLFPFEKELYEKAGVPVTFVGHPLLDLVQPTLSHMEALERFQLEDGLPIIGLLPGSREVEVRRILPTLLKTGEKMKESLPSSARFLLMKAPHLPWKLFRESLQRSSLDVKVAERWDYDCLQICDLVLVASGTATLECALLNRPMIIVYKTSLITYWLGRLFLRIPMIGLVNVVSGRKIVPEFIQHHANPTAIADAALELWNDTDQRNEMKEAFQKIRNSLGASGASSRAAAAILAELD